MSFLKNKVKGNQKDKSDDDKQNEIEIEEQGKFIFIKLLKTSAKDYWEEQISEFNPIWKSLKKGWLVDKKHKNELLLSLEYQSDDDMKSGSEIESREEKGRKRKHNSEDEEDSEEDDSDEDSSTDDELIQKTLTRRILSESSGKVVELESVDDSEMEDIISVCRRFRHVYKQIKTLKDHITYLETKLNNLENRLK